MKYFSQYNKGLLSGVIITAIIYSILIIVIVNDIYN